MQQMDLASCPLGAAGFFFKEELLSFQLAVVSWRFKVMAGETWRLGERETGRRGDWEKGRRGDLVKGRLGEGETW